MDKAALQTLTRLSVKNYPELRSLLSSKALLLLDDAQPNSQDQTNVFEPLFRDAVARMIKREMNDLRGAVKRNLAKGQTDEFDRWCDKFYGIDHPEFARNLFQPILEAQKRSGIDSQDALQAYLSQYMELRRAEIGGEPAEQLEKDIEAWLIEAPNQVSNEIIQAILE